MLYLPKLLSQSQWKVLFGKLGLQPTPAMGEVFWSNSLLKLVMGGEGSGKSLHGALYALNFLADPNPQIEKPRHYMIIADSYAECRPEFKYLLEFVNQLGLLKDKKMPDDKDEPCVLVTRTGQEFYTYSAKDPMKISSSGVTPYGIIGCEVGKWEQEAWGRVIGRAMRVPCWLWASGSFETSTGWVAETWKLGQTINKYGLQSWSIPSWTNINLYPAGRDDPKLEIGRLGYDKERYIERIEGKPCPPAGIVYKDFSATTHIRPELVFQPERPVYLAIDPGYHVYAVLACQLDEKENRVYVFDEIYETGRTSTDIITMCKKRPWWGKVVGGAIDVAATQHHADRSAEEVWRAESGLALDFQKVMVEDGIERVMTFLQVDAKTGQPSLFVAPRCKGIISEMGAGASPISGRVQPYAYQENQDGTFSDKPRPEHNHSCTALTYLLVAKFGYVNRGQKLSPANYLEAVQNQPYWEIGNLSYLEGDTNVRA